MSFNVQMLTPAIKTCLKLIFSTFNRSHRHRVYLLKAKQNKKKIKKAMFIICRKIRIQSNVTRAHLKTDGDDQNKVKKKQIKTKNTIL